MIKPKFFIFAIVFLFGLSAVFAQTDEKNQIEQSYEVILHVVVASNKQNEKGKLPPSLSAVISNLKNDFLYTELQSGGDFSGKNFDQRRDRTYRSFEPIGSDTAE